MLFDSETIDATSVIVKFSYGGDANLDGAVNVLDTAQIDQGIANHLRGWYNGDFNYDGTINILDYATQIDVVIGNQLVGKLEPLARRDRFLSA